MKRLNRKSLLLLTVSFGIAGIVWSQMGMYLVHLFFGVDVKVNFFKFCMSLFRENTLYYFIVITLLNAVIAYSMLVALIKLIRHYSASRHLKAKLLALRDIQGTAQLIVRYQPVNQHIMVISHHQPMAFTIGLRRPLVVLSSALIALLDDEELEAVLQHEIFHQKSYDTLRIFVLQLVAESIWFVPIARWSLKNYAILSELMADRYAIQQARSELGLGSALLKLIKNVFSDNPTPVLVHFTDGVVNYRIQQLLEPDHGIPVKANLLTVIVSVFVLCIFLGMVLMGLA